MNESLLRKARNLADGFATADTDDVAHVLGEALLEALAELLVPEDEKPVLAADFDKGWAENFDNDVPHSLDDAKRQHPAYQPAVDLRDASWVQPHPKFLEGEAAYRAAPVGTRTDDGLERRPDGWFDEEDGENGALVTDPLFTCRAVERWGRG